MAVVSMISPSRWGLELAADPMAGLPIKQPAIARAKTAACLLFTVRRDNHVIIRSSRRDSAQIAAVIAG